FGVRRSAFGVRRSAFGVRRLDSRFDRGSARDHPDPFIAHRRPPTACFPLRRPRAVQRLVVFLALVLVVRIVGRVVVGRVAHRKLVVIHVARSLGRARSRMDRLVVVLLPVLALPVVLVGITDRGFLFLLAFSRASAPPCRPTGRPACGSEVEPEGHAGGMRRFCPG
ncbi:MAG: hypothetical protein ABI585_05320, partial [Betaproteobacteria bacterium]